MTGEIDTLSAQLPDAVLIERVLLGEKKLFEVVFRGNKQSNYLIGKSVRGAECKGAPQQGKDNVAGRFERVH